MITQFIHLNKGTRLVITFDHGTNPGQFRLVLDNITITMHEEHAQQILTAIRNKLEHKP